MTRRPPPSILLQRRGPVATVTVDRSEVRNALAPATIRSRALELLLTGRAIGAREVLDIGFVDRVVATGTAFEAVLGLAKAMATSPPRMPSQTSRPCGRAASTWTASPRGSRSP